MTRADTLDARIAFSQFVHRALKTKTGQSCALTARLIYGYFMPLLTTIPEQWQLWTDEIDRLPRGQSPLWYQTVCKAIAEDAKQERRAELAGTKQTVTTKPEVAALLATIGRRG